MNNLIIFIQFVDYCVANYVVLCCQLFYSSLSLHVFLAVRAHMQFDWSIITPQGIV